MIKGALGRAWTVDMRMQKERRPTVASSKYSSIVTTRLEVVRRRAAWPIDTPMAIRAAEAMAAVVAMAAVMVATVAAVMAVTAGLVVGRAVVWERWR